MRNPSMASIFQSQESVFYQTNKNHQQVFMTSPIQTKGDDDKEIVDLNLIEEQMFENKNL